MTELADKSLVFVYPNKQLSNLFSSHQIDQYSKKDDVKYNKTLPPHLYKTIMVLIKEMHSFYRNKTVIFSGESRSYKGTLYNYFIEFIMQYYQSVYLNKQGEKVYFSFKELLKASKIVLEAFGHAKTIKSDNSSRYSEYLTLFINKETLSLEGGRLQTLLFDRERITSPNDYERNYHIFYFLLNSEDTNLLNSLYLKKDPHTYRYLEISNCFTVFTIDDTKSFKTTQAAFDKLGFSKEELESIWRIIASILHLGNIKFNGNGTIDACSKDQEIIYITDLLKIPVNNFIDLLENLEIQTQSKMMKNTSAASYYYRIRQTSYNQIAQQLYTLLFEWIIKTINQKLSPNRKDDEASHSQLMKLTLLRMFGFDNSINNTLYQFLTNYSSEKITQMRIEYHFKDINADYENQNISFRYEDFYDNEDIINLYESPNFGLFKHINHSNKNEHGYLYKNLYELAFKTNTLKIGKNTSKNTLLPDTFTIYHTEGTVDYSISQITHQNLIEIPFEFYECFVLSKCNTIKYLSVSSINEEDYLANKHKLETEIKDMRDKSIHNHYTQLITEMLQSEINEMIKEMSKTELHYIICFKSNDRKEEMKIHPTYLLYQIRYTNILNIINFTQNSYSERMAYADFISKYNSLLKRPNDLGDHHYVNYILNYLDSNKIVFDSFISENYIESIRSEYLEGESKIFMKTSLVKLLNFHLEIVNIQKKYSIAVIIKQLRKIIKTNKIIYFMKLIGIVKRFGFFLKNKIKGKKIIILQAYQRMRMQRQKYIRSKKYIKWIQKTYRKFFRNRHYRMYLTKVICIQTNIRVLLTKVKLKKRSLTQNVIYYLINRVLRLMNRKQKYFASITINRFTKGFLIRKKLCKVLFQIRSNYKRNMLNKAAVKIQSNFRMFFVWINYYELKYQCDKIRNFWRMTRAIKSIRVLRWATIYLQNQARLYINKVKAFQILNHRFIGNEEKIIEQETNEMVQILFPQSNESINNNDEMKQDSLPILQPFKEGISFFSKIIDIDIYNPLCQVYPTKWVKEYDKIERYNMKRSTPIQLISLGTTHTIVLNSKGQMFSWGWNYYSQCGSSSQSTFIQKQSKQHNQNSVFLEAHIVNYQPILVPDSSLPLMTQVTCGEDVSFLLDDNHTLYSFGDNQKGKLGLRNNDPVFYPTIIPDLENKTKEIKSCGEFGFVLTINDEIYLWPTMIDSNYQFSPQLLRLQQKVIIEKISCGKHFAMLLSKNGVVFSVGAKNNKGELGTGDYLPRIKPEPLTIFAANGEKITNITCGFKHTVCLSSNGKAFVWGSNSNGQLCLDKIECYPSPMQVSFENCFPNRVMIIQIAAGFRSSLFLTDTRYILSSGKMSFNSSTSFPSKIDLKLLNNKLANEKKYVPVRLMTTWNNSFSIFYVTFADIRLSKITAQKLKWVLRIISSKWINDSSMMIIMYNYNSIFSKHDLYHTIY